MWNLMPRDLIMLEWCILLKWKAVLWSRGASKLLFMTCGGQKYAFAVSCPLEINRKNTKKEKAALPLPANITLESEIRLVLKMPLPFLNWLCNIIFGYPVETINSVTEWQTRHKDYVSNLRKQCLAPDWLQRHLQNSYSSALHSIETLTNTFAPHSPQSSAGVIGITRAISVFAAFVTCPLSSVGREKVFQGLHHSQLLNAAHLVF